MHSTLKVLTPLPNKIFFLKISIAPVNNPIWSGIKIVDSEFFLIVWISIWSTYLLFKFLFNKINTLKKINAEDPHHGDYVIDIKEDIQTSTPEDQFDQLMSKYDWYYEMSDDPRAYTRGLALDRELRDLGKQIGADKAVDLFNAKAPSDRKVTSSFFMEGKEDKHAKLKELLKVALKKKVTSEDKISDENAKKSAIQTEKAKLLALNKQKQELQADTTKVPAVKTSEKTALDLKIRAATDSLNKLNQGKISVV